MNGLLLFLFVAGCTADEPAPCADGYVRDEQGSCVVGTDDDADDPVTGDDYEGDAAGECSDGVDNDGDGLTDCEDEACAGAPVCNEADADADADSDADADADADADSDADADGSAEGPCDGVEPGYDLGDCAADFTFIDQTGSTVSLYDFAGDVIYLDLSGFT